MVLLLNQVRLWRGLPDGAAGLGILSLACLASPLPSWFQWCLEREEKVHKRKSKSRRIPEEALLTLAAVGSGPPVGGALLPVAVRSVDLDLRDREGPLTDGTVHAGLPGRTRDGQSQLRGRGPPLPSVSGLPWVRGHVQLRLLLFFPPIRDASL